MLVANTGSSYAEMCLDPTVWTEPDAMDGQLTRRVVFRKDQILEIMRRCEQPGFVAKIITERDKQEVPVVRLVAAGFSVEEIARFLERKPRFAAAKRPIDSIMDDEINEDDLFNTAADWMMDSRIEDVSPGTDFAVPESEDDAISVAPPQPARRPPQPPPELETPVAPQRSYFIEDGRETPAPSIMVTSVTLGKQQNRFLMDVWTEIEAEISQSTADKSLAAQERLSNIWSQINRQSDSLDI
jgi:hypothetical protein